MMEVDEQQGEVDSVDKQQVGKNTFLEDLSRFHQNQKTPYTRVPRINGKEVDLHDLYKTVTDLGGWEKVNSSGLWKRVEINLNLPSRCLNSEAALKQIYLRYLEQYERVNFINKLKMYESYSRTKREERDLVKIMHPAPMTYNHAQHIVSDLSRETFGLSRDTLLPSPYEKLALSLISDLPNEQDFAINTCAYLSMQTGRYLASDDPRVLYYLMSHAGVYKDMSLAYLFDDFYREKRGYCLNTFWFETFDNNKWERIESVFRYKNKNGGDYKNFDVYVFDDLVLFRIMQVGEIILNFSSQNHNVIFMAQDEICLKFAIIFITCKFEAISLLGWKIMGNLSPCISHDVSCIDAIIELCIENILVFNSDITFALDILTNLSVTINQVENQVEAACKYVDKKLMEKVVSLIYYDDIIVVHKALDFLYQVTFTSSICCEHIMSIDGVELLFVNLLKADVRFDNLGLWGKLEMACYIDGKKVVYQPRQHVVPKLNPLMDKRVIQSSNPKETPKFDFLDSADINKTVCRNLERSFITETNKESCFTAQNNTTTNSNTSEMSKTESVYSVVQNLTTQNQNSQLFSDKSNQLSYNILSPISLFQKNPQNSKSLQMVVLNSLNEISPSVEKQSAQSSVQKSSESTSESQSNQGTDNKTTAVHKESPKVNSNSDNSLLYESLTKQKTKTEALPNPNSPANLTNGVPEVNSEYKQKLQNQIELSPVYLNGKYCLAKTILIGDRRYFVSSAPGDHAQEIKAATKEAIPVKRTVLHEKSQTDSKNSKVKSEENEDLQMELEEFLLLKKPPGNRNSQGNEQGDQVAGSEAKQMTPNESEQKAPKENSVVKSAKPKEDLQSALKEYLQLKQPSVNGIQKNLQEEQTPLTKCVEQAALAKGLEQADLMKGVEQAAPTKGVEQAAPTKVMEQAAPTKCIEQAAPTKCIEQAAPTKGVEQAAPTKGLEQAAPAKGVEQAAPTKGLEQAAPTKGVDQAIPIKGVEQAEPTKGLEQPAPSEGLQTKHEAMKVDQPVLKAEEVQPQLSNSVKAPRSAIVTNQSKKSTKSKFLCEWRGCMRNFKNNRALLYHVCSVHCNDQTNKKCMWFQCGDIERSSLSLKSHVMSVHCTGSQNRRFLPLNRNKYFTSWSGIWADYELKVQKYLKESSTIISDPLINSVRYTASLIIRNILTNYPEKKGRFKKYEFMFMNQAILESDSAKVLTEILSLLN